LTRGVITINEDRGVAIMKQFLAKLLQDRRTTARKARLVGGSDWMKTQLLRMTELNQGLISMSGGR